MEPSFESHQSAEFDKSQHHIFDAKDVVRVLNHIEPYESPYDTTAMLIQRVRHVLTDSTGFGYYELHEDARTLELMIKNNQADEFEIFQGVREQFLHTARQLRETYISNVNTTIQQLNLFLADNPGLLLWSNDPEDTVNAIEVKEGKREGEVVPIAQSDALYVNVDHLDDVYRPLVIEALSDV